MNKYGLSFSLNRLLGITEVKRQISRQSGIPLTKSGLEKKVGRLFISMLFK